MFCKDVQLVSGAAERTLFGDVTRACWEPGSTPIPLAGGLVRIGGQLSANLPPFDRPFDWCLKDLRPILASP